MHLFRSGTTSWSYRKGETAQQRGHEQGAGEHGSWVVAKPNVALIAQLIRTGYGSAEGRAMRTRLDSWVGAFVREQGAGNIDLGLMALFDRSCQRRLKAGLAASRNGDFHPVNPSMLQVPYVGPNADAPSGAVSCNPAPVATGTRTGDHFVGQWNFKVEINGIETKDSKFLSVS